jgi:hypothetical protein
MELRGIGSIPKIGDEHLKWQLEAAYSIVETKHLSIDCHVPQDKYISLLTDFGFKLSSKDYRPNKERLY